MSEHEPCVGGSSEWFTPPAIFDALAMRFDLDPCSPGADHWVPAERVLTKADNGLAQPWHGTVFMNPPFGGRNGQVPWIRKLLEHSDGIGLVAARTSAGWFHELMPRVDLMLFPRGKTKFVRPDGSVGGSPGTGVVLFSVGERANAALRRCGLGMCVPVRADDRAMCLRAIHCVKRLPHQADTFIEGLNKAEHAIEAIGRSCSFVAQAADRGMR